MEIFLILSNTLIKYENISSFSVRPYNVLSASTKHVFNFFIMTEKAAFYGIITKDGRTALFEI